MKTTNLLYNYTDVEQSRRLMAAGLDPKTSDMSWETACSINTGGRYWVARQGQSPAVRMDLFSFRSGHILPCWSLAALFVLLPVIDGDTPRLWRMDTSGCPDEDNYRIGYDRRPFAACGATMIDAAVDVVCQMLDAGWTFAPTW